MIIDNDKKKYILKEFQTIPTVGKATAEDLYVLGYRSINDLKNQNPENMYKRLLEIQNLQHNICMLYVFRLVVYYANTQPCDPKLLKWWLWKDPEAK